MSTLVELIDVHKDYGEGTTCVHALKDIDLQIRPAEFTAMAGPSGSGKTSLLNLIGGLDRPTSGEVILNGKALNSLRAAALARVRRDEIGFVFQNYSLLPVLTAYENAEYVLMIRNVPARQRREKVRAILKEVGLGGMEDRFPRQLSGGQQQRVAIARAIASDPVLVLADEPTANLDSKTGAGLLDLMAKLNAERGTTFLFSTHDPAVIKRARRLLWLHDGRITYDGKPEERSP